MITAAKTRVSDAEAMGLEVPVIDFVAPMPGFPDLRKFVLVRVLDEGVLYALTSIENPDLRFLVVPPIAFFPDYAPEIDEESLAALGATASDVDSLSVMLVVTPGETAGSSTANLMAPIVVHEAKRTAVQLMLGGDYAVRATLMPA